jgi:cell division protein FtsL
MNRKLRLLLIMTIPVFVFVNIYQTYSYQRLDQSVATLESQQKAWLEHNKRIIAGIAVLSAPGRIDEIARDKLNLRQNPLEPTLRIRVPRQSKTNDG